MKKIRADEVAAQMYEENALQLSELNEIQYKYSRNDTQSAEILLKIVLKRPAHVYRSFLRALENNNQYDAYLLLADDGLCKWHFLHSFFTSIR